VTHPGDAVPRRYGFVMEQTLGHVTHYKNLRSVIDDVPAVSATWHLLTFPPRGTLETLPLLRSNWSLRAGLRARRTLATADAPRRYDALFFHTQVTALLSAGLMRRVPSVVSLDATPINYDSVGIHYGHHPSRKPVEALKTALNRRSLHAARALVVWCDWARRSLIDDYGIDASRITVISPGVDFKVWPHPSTRPGKQAGQPVRILFVGGDFERKGGEVLLRAFNAGLRESCELHLVTKAPIEEVPGIHVYRNIGPNSEQLLHLYRTADLFVLPTLGDCFSVACIEALACGLPVITCPVGGIPELLQDGENGLLVPPGDTRALGAAIAALAGDESRRRGMGAKGRALAEQRFDNTVNVRRILAIMRSVAEEDAVNRQTSRALNAAAGDPQKS